MSNQDEQVKIPDSQRLQCTVLIRIGNLPLQALEVVVPNLNTEQLSKLRREILDVLDRYAVSSWATRWA